MTASPEPTLNYISHDDFLRDVEAVARAIEADGWRTDFLVGIGRGGLAPATYLSHRLDVPLLSVDHSSKVAGFADELLVKLAGLLGDGKRVLFVDDINDSGSTIAYLRETVSRHGDTGGLRFAVLIDNSRSMATVDYRARTIDRSIDKDWFVFPWEAVARRATLMQEAQEVPERLA
ncbi:MAG TPA: phosphoribosyltransferase family protein [Sphingomonas sp.]